ncbi:MAG TPA: hypothetical protein VE032_00715 [Actinomycetota bacterium]|nr:hypothetical protein [Actinomycetota bacterium]
MSVPATDPIHPTVDGARPARTPAARPPPSSLPLPTRRARRGSTSFWALSAVIVTGLVVGVVSLSALLVSASFREERIRTVLATLAEEHEGLSLQVVTLSSPVRVAAWARGEGFVAAERVDVLRVRARGAGR